MRTIYRDIVGAFIFSSDGYFLIGKSRKGGVYKDMWIIPGGGIEENETKLQAAIRETKEEVGIDISNFDLKLLDETYTGESEKVLSDTGEKVLVKMTFYDFIVNTNKPASEVKVVAGDDLIEAKWYPVTDLKNITLSPPTKNMLELLGYL